MVDEAEVASVHEELDALVSSVTPLGWKKLPVRPPWPRRTAGCRSCGKDGRSWAVVVLMRRDEEKKRLLYTVAAVCSRCADDKGRMSALKERAFAL